MSRRIPCYERAFQDGLAEAKRRMSVAGMHDGKCPEPNKPCTCGIDAAIGGTALVSKARTGSYTTCQHPERYLRWVHADDFGDWLEEPTPKCGWCGKWFRSKAEARRERAARMATS